MKKKTYRGMAEREFFTLVQRCLGTNRAARRLRASLARKSNPEARRALGAAFNLAQNASGPM